MRSCFAACMTGLMLTAGVAHAAPGEHILAGEAIIIPKIDLGVEYRTNAYQRETDPIPATNIRVAPGFEVSAAGPQTEFEASGTSELRYMLVGANRRVANLDRFTDFNVGSSLRLLQDQVLQFHFTEMAGLKNNITQAGQDNNPFHTQFRNDFNMLVPIRVGPAIEVTPAGQWAFDDFRIPGQGRDNDFRHFNSRNTFNAGLDLKWTFFPRTAAVLEADYDFNLWSANQVSTGNAGGNPFGDTIFLPNSSFIKLSTGIRGRFTQRLVLIVTGGYGIGNYQDAGAGDTDVAGLQRLLALVQARYDLGPGNRLALGFRKDFEDSWFANYVAYNYIYGRLENRFGPRFGSSLDVGFRFEGYAGQVSRADILLRVKGDVSYNVQDWMSFSGGVWWTQRASDDARVQYNDANIHLLTNFTY